MPVDDCLKEELATQAMVRKQYQKKWNSAQTDADCMI